jgi:hypothetical protein
MRLFTVEERERIQRHILDLAHADERVVSGAIVGSRANGGGDRWSDLDLTFGLAEGVRPVDVLDDWTSVLAESFRPVHLFDLPFRAILYRVFLFPGNLQVDVSCAPAVQWGAHSPKFELLFGTAIPQPHVPSPDDRELFGYAVHHLVRARISIERGRLLEAEHLLHEARNHALAHACLRAELPALYGRGLDRLPDEPRSRAEETLVRELSAWELLRALGATVELLLSVARAGPVAELEADLRSLSVPPNP